MKACLSYGDPTRPHILSVKPLVPFVAWFTQCEFRQHQSLGAVYAASAKKIGNLARWASSQSTLDGQRSDHEPDGGRKKDISVWSGVFTPGVGSLTS